MVALDPDGGRSVAAGQAIAQEEPRAVVDLIVVRGKSRGCRRAVRSTRFQGSSNRDRDH